MKKYLLFTVMIVLLCSMVAFAQSSVSGKVTDESDGSGLPGVNVVEKGTTNGTVTDFDGNYTLSVGDGATIVFSFVGYLSQEVVVGNQSTIDVALGADVTQLSEVVVVGYGSQEKKEITSAVVSLDAKDFNQGNVNDASQLLQGKVPGLSIYNKGGDPNSNATIRLRGISTIGANTQPLVVIDGVIGASLDNVDPNDIESINVLKDGSAAAIYGSRGSAGVILVTTKRGSRGDAVSATYNGFVAAATILDEQPVMSAAEYVENGGNDLGSETDWLDEVTRTGITQVHNVAISGSAGDNTTFRLSTNFRDVNGILEESGFDQINARASISHFAIDDRLKIDFNMSFTNRESNFSFNEALRYATLYNPTAPVRFDNGDFFQAILFDNFNPAAIIDQNENVGTRKNLNFNIQAQYSITDQISVTANYGQQYTNNLNGQFYPTTSFFRGLNRNGLASRYTDQSDFTLFETFVNYTNTFDKFDLSLTGGYSFQENFFESLFIEAGNLPTNDLGFYGIDFSSALIGAPGTLDIDAVASPDERIIAFFGRVNLTFDDAIFFNASLRREGSTKLGADNQFATFPALGLGVDLNKYLGLDFFSNLKLRGGYGVTGSLPNQSGLSQASFDFLVDGGGDFAAGRAANPDLKWEEKAEINVGIDFGLMDGRLTGTLDFYTRDISDFILEREVDPAVFGASTQFQNVGELQTRGAELALNYDAIVRPEFTWNTGVVLSTYTSTLEAFPNEVQSIANLGAPGQNETNMVRVAVGEEIGQIWGPVFAGVDAEGNPVFADLNGDGQVLAAPGDALNPDGDFTELGNGLPDLELGWTNILTYKKWDFNLFFRAAFGHSLVNTFRAFYEPIDPGAINSYNRIITDEAVEGLVNAQYSSLYVEKADFFKLDNATVGYTFDMGNSTAFKRLRLYANVQNAFVITGYTGIDPEPVLQDFGPVDNGGVLDTTNPNVLAPGIDRRNNYFTARTFTFGVNLGF